MNVTAETDPGKGVDNDFAAILIRKYDHSGKIESDATRNTPLASAEWYPVGLQRVDRHTVVHTARSDVFTLHLGSKGNVENGLARIWLIYADFLGAKLPKTWPQEPEYAGGILAYFETEWSCTSGNERRVKLQHMLPQRATGFDWKQWALQAREWDDPKKTARLSDE